MPFIPVREEIPRDDGTVTIIEEYKFVPQEGEDLSYFILHAKQKIKQEAATLIGNISWKLSRNEQRETLGIATLKDRAAIYAEIESIRQSSNKAEELVSNLTSYEDIINYSWEPTLVIVDPPYLLTHVEFIKRFTQEEYQNIVQATETNIAVKANWNIFFSADYVNFSDSKTIEGVNLLEAVGLIGAGRANEILT